ncbi:hypothetical protein [Xanthomonas maliensis]|uniref:hypothetical protein n=1 Tax=Xanthomonas maliensis TaxID=1321368 RepID=UPI0003B6D2BA|nr:hypothetical protein [Xanthomonas maliensis]KAB7763829.1 hypothetical protein CKY51_18940 [Xanthomonas maliensis]
MRVLPLLLSASALACSAHEPARPAAPANDCLDARALVELQQPAAETLLVTERGGRHFRLQLAQACPELATQADARLLAPHGWVCNGAPAMVAAGQTQCAIGEVAPVSPRDYAALTRQHDAASIATLDPLTVRQQGRRAFVGNSAYCFHPGLVRSWSEDDQGLLVEVAAQRHGGHRYYRVELMDNCSELNGSPPIRFVSGMGLNAICGNPGDKVDIVDQFAITGAGAVTRPGQLARMRQSCTVAAVYPRD